MMQSQRIARDESNVANLSTPTSGYQQEWRRDPKATTSLHSGLVLPGFTPKH